jgi:hypothetical protein
VATPNAADSERRSWTPAERWFWLTGVGFIGIGFVCLGVIWLRYPSSSYIKIPVQGPLPDQIISILAAVGLGGSLFILLGWMVANSVANQIHMQNFESPELESHGAELSSEERTGRLLTRNATTGWRDWLQGELWLFSGGLLRVPIGPLKALLLMGYIPVGSGHVREFSAAEFASIIANPYNLWIPANQIEDIRLGHTILADELRITLRNQQSIRLLWLPSRRIFRLLQERIHEWD